MLSFYSQKLQINTNDKLVRVSLLLNYFFQARLHQRYFNFKRSLKLSHFKEKRDRVLNLA